MLSEIKCCAVCGDTSKVNTHLKWKRDFDNRVFSVCVYCAEQDKVNEKSVENFKDGCLGRYRRTPYEKQMQKRFRGE